MQKYQQAGDVASHETMSHSNNPDVSASGMPPIQSNSGGQTPVNTKYVFLARNCHTYCIHIVMLASSLAFKDMPEITSKCDW